MRCTWCERVTEESPFVYTPWTRLGAGLTGTEEPSRIDLMLCRECQTAFEIGPVWDELVRTEFVETESFFHLVQARLYDCHSQIVAKQLDRGKD